MDPGQADRRRRSRTAAAVAVGLVVLVLAVLLATRLLAPGDDAGPPPVAATEMPAASSARTTPAPEATGSASTPSPTSSPTPAPTATTAEPSAVTLDQRCQGPAGFSVARPVDWFTNEEPAPELCAWFGPSPVEVPSAPGGDVLAPVGLSVQDGVDVATVSAPDPGVETVTDRRETTVDGRRAFRLESTTVDEGVFPAGTRTVYWAVELPPDGDVPRTLLATAFPCCDVELSDAAQVLDAMVASLELAG